MKRDWRSFWTGAAAISLLFFGLAATYVDGVRRDIVSGEAGQFSAAYPVKGTPVGADRILIEDSAASNAKAYTTLTTAVAGAVSHPFSHQSGVGAVSTTTADDDIVPNVGAGTVGASDDFWDTVYAEEIGLGSAGGAGAGGSWRGETIGGAQALSWFSAAGGATRRLAITENVRSVVFKNYFQVNGNGPAFRFDSNAALSGANDDIVEFYNGGVEKARIKFDGAIWTAGNIASDSTSLSMDEFTLYNDGTYIRLFAEAASGLAIQMDADVTSGDAFILKTTSAMGSGRLLSLKNDGDTKFRVNYVGDVTLYPGKIYSETADGTTPFLFTSSTAHTSGTILSVMNDASEMISVDYLGSMDLAGGISASIVTKTANYTATVADYVIIGNPTGGDITITLPAADTRTGMTYVIKNIHVTNSVFINGDGAWVDGQPSIELSNQYEYLRLVTDSVTWWEVG